MIDFIPGRDIEPHVAPTTKLIQSWWISPTALLSIVGLSSASLLVSPSAYANCVTAVAATTCNTATPNPQATLVGAGPADNNRTVTVNSGATINTTNNNAISLGNGANITVNGTVMNTANSGGGDGAAGTGNNTVEFVSNSRLVVGPNGKIIANGNSADSEPINPSGFGNTIINYGLIQANNASAAIWFQDTQVDPALKNDIENYGTIERVGGGSVIGSTVGNGVIFFNHAGAQVLGSLTFGSGNDDLVLEAGSRITGSVDGGGGTNTLTLLGAAGTSATLQTNIINFGTLTKDGLGQWTVPGALNGFNAVTVNDGLLTLTGNNVGFTGLTTVNGGTLQAGASGAFSPNSSFAVTGGTLDANGIDQTVKSLGNAGTVATNLKGGSPGTTLTVAGNYSGNGGTVVLDTHLGGDNSPTDRLVVNGSTSGASTLKVINVGGAGAPTFNGIEVVSVAGASNGSFALAGQYVFNGAPAMIAGAYAYQLYKNGVSTPTDGNWYLRSQLMPSPSKPTAPPAPLYQPGVPLYESYAQTLLGFEDLGTLQQRVGNRSWTDGSIEGQGLWARIETVHGGFSPEISTSSSSYTTEFWRLQAGAEGTFYDDARGKLVAGITAHYGDISSYVSSLFGSGKIQSTGYGVGGTLTWYGTGGAYIDAVAQATWFDSSLYSDTLSRSLTTGNGAFGQAWSLEGGQRIAIGPRWTLTPQAQLVYSKVDFDRFTDPFGALVSLDQGDSLRGRLGLSADYDNIWKDVSGRTSRTHVYGIANLYYEALGGTQTVVSGAELASANDRLWGGVGLGASYDWNDNRYSVYAEGTLNTSLENFGSSYTVKGNVGFRVKW
jgi:fibronectin-binding autotransporter adhesin